MTETEDVRALPYPVPRTDPGSFPQELAKLRSDRPTCPVMLPTGDPAWMATRFEDVKTVLSDRRFSRAAMCEEGAARFQALRPSPESILGMDPPRHNRVRQAIAQEFTVQRAQEISPRIREVADELLDAMADLPRPVDLVSAFARPLPLLIICEILGLPREDQALFASWTQRVMQLDATEDALVAAYLELRDYFVEVIKRKRAEPGDDVISVLLKHAGDGELTLPEAVSLGGFLLVAGHDTSVTVLADSALALMQNPDQLELLRQDPSLWPSAVEELLRLTNPGGSLFPRIAMTDVEIGGVKIAKGEAVVAHIGAGCRDEAVVDDPERLDIRRDTGFQIYFGHGPHFCLGAPLGRAETEIGLRALFGRFPDLRLAVEPEDLEWRNLNALGGFAQFPVTW